LKDNERVGWSYWAYNGYKETPEDDEGYGILKADMKTVRYPWLLQDLQSI